MGLNALYLGPSSPRGEAMVALLHQHCASVRTGSIQELGPELFNGVDVAIVDGTWGQDSAPRTLFADQFPVPTVLVGAYGGAIADALGLKLGSQHGCICLDHRAILAERTTEHPIFHGPLKVGELDVRVIPTPHALADHTPDAPEKLHVFPVGAGKELPNPTIGETEALAKRIAEASRTGDTDFLLSLSIDDDVWGVVSTSAGFLDSPDCERLLGGINSKAIDYVAVGRQGRFLLWGFDVEPDKLTDAGRALFLNALDYIVTFRDAPLLSASVTEPRQMLRYVLQLLDRGARPEDRIAYLLGDVYPAELEPSAAAALAWYDDNRGYLRRVGAGRTGHYELDEDLVAVGFANDDLQLLDTIAERLDSPGEEGDRARRLWTRYTHRPADAADVERAWLAAHRPALFFTDWGGYRWLSADERVPIEAPRFDAAGTGPVSTLMWASYDSDDIVVNLQLDIDPGFYLYAPGARDGIPVTVTLDPTYQARLLSGPDIPIPDDLHLRGRVPITLRLDGADPVVHVKVRVQACDEQVCLAPTTFNLTAVAGR